MGFELIQRRLSGVGMARFRRGGRAATYAVSLPYPSR